MARNDKWFKAMQTTFSACLFWCPFKSPPVSVDEQRPELRVLFVCTDLPSDNHVKCMVAFKTAYSAKNQARADSLSRNRELRVCQQQGATILFVRAK